MNNNLDLIWVIPEIVGSFIIAIAAALHISKIQPHTIIGLMEWIFQIGIVLAVVAVGIKGINIGCDALRDVIKNDT